MVFKPNTNQTCNQNSKLVQQQRMTLAPPNHVRQKTRSSSAAANANGKPYLVKTKSPLDHHDNKGKEKKAIPGTSGSVSHHQPILKTRVYLANNGKKNYDTHKQIQKKEEKVNNVKMPLDHHDNKGKEKKAIPGTSGSVSHHQPILKTRVYLANKRKKNYDTHKQIQKKEEKVNNVKMLLDHHDNKGKEKKAIPGTSGSVSRHQLILKTRVYLAIKGKNNYHTHKQIQKKEEKMNNEKMPLDHHDNKGKEKKAIPGTSGSVSRHQLILKTRVYLAIKGKNNYHTHKQIQKKEEKMNNEKMPLDHHDNKGKEKKAIPGTSGSVSRHQLILKTRVYLALKGKNNYHTHKQIQKKEEKMNNEKMPLDHHDNKGKEKKAIPGTSGSVSRHQLILKTRVYLAIKGKNNYHTHKQIQKKEEKMNNEKMPLDHHDNKGKEKKAIPGTSGSVSRHQLILKTRVYLAIKGKNNYHTHIQKKEEKVNNEKMIGQSSKSFCGICFDFKPAYDMFRRSKCNHPFCTDCISKHVVTKIQQNVLKVNCPNPNCHVELKPKYLQPILPKEVIDRWEFVKYESSIALSQKFYCPFKNCSALLVNDEDGGNVVTSSECPYCHRLFCAQCKVQWHAGMNCKEFQNLKRNKGEKDLDRKFMELAKSNMWQRCPECSIYVQRRSGCEHIICSCGCHFCYNCGKNWKFGHLCNSRWST